MVRGPVRVLIPAFVCLPESLDRGLAAVPLRGGPPQALPLADVRGRLVHAEHRHRDAPVMVMRLEAGRLPRHVGAAAGGEHRAERAAARPRLPRPAPRVPVVPHRAQDRVPARVQRQPLRRPLRHHQRGLRVRLRRPQGPRRPLNRRGRLLRRGRVRMYRGELPGHAGRLPRLPVVLRGDPGLGAAVAVHQGRDRRRQGRQGPRQVRRVQDPPPRPLDLRQQRRRQGRLRRLIRGGRVSLLAGRHRFPAPLPRRARRRYRRPSPSAATPR